MEDEENMVWSASQAWDRLGKRRARKRDASPRRGKLFQ